MHSIYPTIYRDALGEEQTVIENDGQTLRMVVRGVEFEGGGFDGLTAKTPEEALHAGFTLDSYHDLIAATLIFEVPMLVVAGVKAVPSVLTVHIDLEGAGPRVEADRHWSDPRMSLSVGDKQYSSSGGWGCFEMELLQIQRQLPSDAYMKCCFNCAFSGYNPYGNGLWGMFCHRNHKVEYLRASTKVEWLQVPSAGTVQEIYLCPEFQRWNGETGYRDGLFINRLSVTLDRTDSLDRPAAALPVELGETGKT